MFSKLERRARNTWTSSELLRIILLFSSGEDPLDELTMERTMEALESQCHDNMRHAIDTVEGLGIEYDEDVICDVCRSPDSEEGNDMVFCDKCNICVHQVETQGRTILLSQVLNAQLRYWHHRRVILTDNLITELKTEDSNLVEQFHRYLSLTFIY